MRPSMLILKEKKNPCVCLKDEDSWFLDRSNNYPVEDFPINVRKIRLCGVFY